MRVGILALLAIAAMLLAGCVQPGPWDSDGNAGPANGIDLNLHSDGMPEEKPVVELGDTVWLQYTALLPDGTIYESTGAEGIAFEAGRGQVLKCFEDAVIGMAIGEEKNLSPEIGDAYGYWQEEKVLEIDLNEFAEAGITPEPGLGITYGEAKGKVIEVNEETKKAKVDFNHELAGRQVFFWISVIAINKGPMEGPV